MSTQNTSTPWAFIEAVEYFFKIKFKYDMAADSENTKAPYYYDEKDDSFSIEWPRDGWIWLNPDFQKLTKWVNAVHEEYEKGAKIITIWPLSGDLNQIPTWKSADVYIIHGRVWPNVRGCMLCIWNKRSITSQLPYNPVFGLRWDGNRLARVW